MPAVRPARPGPTARRAARSFLADLRGGRAFLSAELTRPGWLDFGAFRWRDLAVGPAVRSCTGVLVPLIVGVATGHTAYGSYAALGALPAGFVSFRGVSRTRVVAVLCAAAGMAIATFTGATAALHPWLLVPVVFAWAYLTGLLASLGPTVLAVTLQWPVALLIASALPLDPAAAGIRAGLVLAGGLWQCLLVISSWTVNRGSAERTALAGSYTAMAEYATDVAAGQQEPPPPGQLAAARVLTDPNPLMRTVARQHLLDLTDEAERIRASLTAMSIGRDQPPGAGSRDVLTVAARVLTQIASAVGGRPRERAGHLATALRELSGSSGTTGVTWQWASEALLGQLRGACGIVERLNDAEPAPGHARTRRPIWQNWRLETLLTLRASIGTSSETGRHALRLAVATALAQAIVSASQLSHGYWAVLTIFIVLRPDYSSTLYRGLQRSAGTAAGAGLGLATVQLDRLGHTALLVGVGVCLAAAYSVFTVNYLLYGVFLTDFVVVLLALLGLRAEPTAVARLVGTGVGTGLAIMAYVLWPTWEGTSAAEKFARLITAQGAYASALLRAYARPAAGLPTRLSQLQLDARRARINAEASADRLAGEPDQGQVTAAQARLLESAGHRVAQAGLTLGAVVTAHHGTLRTSSAHAASGSGRGGTPGVDTSVSGASPDLQSALDRLATGVDEAVGQLAAALRGGTPEPASLPPLRALQREVWLHPGEATGLAGEATGLAGEATGLAGEAAGLFAATDGLVDAIDTVAHVLSQPSLRR